MPSVLRSVTGLSTKKGEDSVSAILRWYTWFVFVFVAIAMIGYRDYGVGVDTYGYSIAFDTLGSISYAGVYEVWSDRDAGFYILSKFIAGIIGTRGVFIFYSVIIAISILVISSATNRKNLYLPIAIYATMPSMYALGGNVIRQGAAVSLLLVGTSLAIKNKKIYSLLFLFSSILLHVSSLVYILAFFTARIAKIKTLIICIVTAIVFTLSGVGLHHIAQIVDVGSYSRSIYRLTEYFKYSSGGYDTGLRLDFIVYTLIPIIYILLVISVRKIKMRDLDYKINFLLKIYMIISVIFIMSMSYPYSDRIGAYAWILMPIIISYAGEGSGRNDLTYLIRLVTILFVLAINIYILY